MRWSQFRCAVHRPDPGMTSLAPDIVDAILRGEEPEGMSLEKLRKDLPVLRLGVESAHYFSEGFATEHPIKGKLIRAFDSTF